CARWDYSNYDYAMDFW
nr:immunoglobulin heavy chain junction region [Mus musculus]